jgi:hypothetical protein
MLFNQLAHVYLRGVSRTVFRKEATEYFRNHSADSGR